MYVVIRVFLLHLYTWLGTASNYSGNLDLYNSKLTTEYPKHFPTCCVFSSHYLTLASNSGYSSVSYGHAVDGWPPFRNCTHAPNCPCYNISALTTYKTPRFHCCNPTVALLRICYLATETCLRNDWCLQSRRLATDLCAEVCLLVLFSAVIFLNSFNQLMFVIQMLCVVV